MKNLLFICDPIEDLTIRSDYIDVTYLMMVEAFKLNHQIYFASPSDLYLIQNQSFVNTNLVELNIDKQFSDYANPPKPWYKLKPKNKQLSLTHFNTVLVRNDPPFNMEYYYLSQILAVAESQGVQVLNNTHALRNFNEKLSILNFPHLIPQTLVTKDKDVIMDFLDEYPQCVVKPLDLMSGQSVFKLSKDDPNCSTILEVVTNYGEITVMVQEFIPEVKSGDRRVFIVNGEVIPHCLYRIPRGNSIRGNISAGGIAEIHPISEKEAKLANEVAVWLKHQKIIFSGIDIIGNKLTEINITSPGATYRIFSDAGVNIPKLIIEKL